MGDCQHSATSRRQPNHVFAYLAEVGNLPHYFDHALSTVTES